MSGDRSASQPGSQASGHAGRRAASQAGRQPASQPRPCAPRVDVGFLVVALAAQHLRQGNGELCSASGAPALVRDPHAPLAARAAAAAAACGSRPALASGAVHSGVPAWLLVLSQVDRLTRDSPKSHTCREEGREGAPQGSAGGQAGQRPRPAAEPGGLPAPEAGAASTVNAAGSGIRLALMVRSLSTRRLGVLRSRWMTGGRQVCR